MNSLKTLNINRARHGFNVLLSGTLNSYSQVFFSKNNIYAIFLLAVTFIDWHSGLSGLVAALSSNIMAFWLGFNRDQIKTGNYGFNALLSGLGLAWYFAPSVPFYSIVIVASVLSLFITLSLEGVLYKYGLPYISIPFIITLWITYLAATQFTSLGINMRDLFAINRYYALGGTALVSFHHFWSDLPIPEIVITYFKSISAIFFSVNIFAGVITTVGLLLVSRIAFSLSLVGFFSAFGFYQFIGADFTALSYSYIGFNYILTAIAIGGFFMVPTKQSYLWSILLIPIVALFSTTFSSIFLIWGLSIYALPFNMVVLLFLYILKLRWNENPQLQEVIIQHNSPEQNLYINYNEAQRFGNREAIPIHLPFYGAWMVNQGFDGELTHKDNWRFAWDFIINDSNGKQFKNEGLELTDYYCYGKQILAPADGIVEEVIFNIPDNNIGDVNLSHNWGNTIIIEHAHDLYSKLCHLKTDSVTIKKGDSVKKGQVIAECGNSGRSPYPHLHFQLQKTPHIGSETIKYPIAEYINYSNGKPTTHSYQYPMDNQLVESLTTTPLLTNAFHLIPGQKLNWKNGEQEEIWQVHATPFNETYIQCKDSNSRAWFENNDSLFWFSHFEGNRKTFLYEFFLSVFKVPLGLHEGIRVVDPYPINKIFKPHQLIIQDFVAPMWIYKKATYTMTIANIDNTTFPSAMTLESALTANSHQKYINTKFTIDITHKGITSVTISTIGRNQNQSIWEREL